MSLRAFPGRMGDQEKIDDQNAGNSKNLPGFKHLDQHVYKFLGHTLLSSAYQKNL
jgi:hypothetical protein